MHDYERQLKNGLWLAKRGYAYYLYSSLENIKADDEQVSQNVARLNKGIPVFNRCYNGSWLCRSRKMSEVKSYAALF